MQTEIQVDKLFGGGKMSWRSEIWGHLDDVKVYMGTYGIHRGDCGVHQGALEHEIDEVT